MIVWETSRKFGLAFTAIGLAVGLLILGIGSAMGETGRQIAYIFGPLVAVVFAAIGIPLCLWGRSKLREREYIANSGRRITAVVDSVHQQHIHAEGVPSLQKYWAVSAYGPDLGGGERSYTEMIGKTKPNLRRGDQVTIAVHPADPTKFALLLPGG